MSHSDSHTSFYQLRTFLNTKATSLAEAGVLKPAIQKQLEALVSRMEGMCYVFVVVAVDDVVPLLCCC